MSQGTKKHFAPQVRSFDLSRASINEDARTVDVTFSTETDEVERWFGVEILDHSPKSVRLKRLNNSAPLLLDHDSREQVGVIEAASIAGKAGTATVRFSKSAKGEEIFQDVRDGIRSKVSVGYRVHALVMEKRDKASGKETYRVTDWEPFEISLVSIPADDSAGVRSAESIFGQRAASLSTSIIMENIDNDTQERAALASVPAATVTAETPNQIRASEVDKQLSEIEIRQIADSRASEIANAEIQRREDLRAYGSRFSIPKEDIDKAIKEKRSLDQFKVEILERVAVSNPAYSVGNIQSDAPTAEKGSRAAMLTSFAEAAKPALAARGVTFHIPNYAARQDVVRNYIDNGGDQFHRSMSGAVTLIDVAKLDAGIGYPLISEVAVLAPETRVFPVDVINGASVELSVNLTAATVGFRNANEGTTPSIGTFESRLFQTQVIEHPIVVDIQGVLQASKDPARVLESTARTVLDGVVKHIGVQTWYGGTTQSGVDAKAAPGLLAQSNTASTHVVDADGSNALTSAYMVRLGDTSCDMVYGNGTTLNMGDWMEETVESAAGKKLRALVAYISGRVAPRLANKNALVRIKKIGTDTGKKMTDLLLFSAFEKFLTLGQEPNAIFMGPRSLEQLRASRTATNPSGAPAPIPTDWNGIPIYLTNSLSIAETV